MKKSASIYNLRSSMQFKEEERPRDSLLAAELYHP